MFVFSSDPEQKKQITPSQQLRGNTWSSSARANGDTDKNQIALSMDSNCSICHQGLVMLQGRIFLAGNGNTTFIFSLHYVLN